jgi:cyclase
VVRLYQGDFNKLSTYSEDPSALLRYFTKKGFDLIHVINLNGARSGEFEQGPNYKLIRSLIEESKKWRVKIQLGGGLRTEKIIKKLLDLGLFKAIVGTLAIQDQLLFQRLLHNYKNDIIIALDVQNNTISTQGWLKNSYIGLTTLFSQFESQGAVEFLVTDISRDGTLSGPNLEMYKDLSKIKHIDTKLIAAGGIGNLEDIKKCLKYTDGVVIGKALYENKININDLIKLKLEYDPTNLARRIIPCLDVKDGRVVKGVQFNNLEDSGDPVALAQFYNQEGADELVFLDISATLEDRDSIIPIIKKVAEEVYIPFTVGGGIRNLNDIRRIIKAGAEKVCINTAAVKNPKLIRESAKKFGSQSIVVAIDVKQKGSAWEVYIKSGTEPTGLDGITWAKKVVDYGAGELLVTSMDRDGTQSGYDLRLIRELCKAVSVPVIASGGAGNYDHFYNALNVGAEAVLAASLFHKRLMLIRDLKSYLLKKDIQIRI